MPAYMQLHGTGSFFRCSKDAFTAYILQTYQVGKCTHVQSLQLSGNLLEVTIGTIGITKGT